MARPTTAPRLSQIDPTALADEVARAALEHVAHQLLSYGAFDGWALPEPSSLLSLRHTVTALVLYARDGVRLDAPLEEYLISLLPLWRYAADDVAVETPQLDRALDGDVGELEDCWRDRLVLVCVAALGREDVERGRRVTAARLAALGGITPMAVRALARSGELALSGDPLTATAREARRWLGARGVAGV